MQPIPKIVRERLKAPIAPSDHPDGDLLAAFSERSLPALERDIVLEHLGRCSECREIVALALPASEDMQAVLQPGRSRFAWAAFRWGVVTAGLAVIASLGVLQYRKHTRAVMSAMVAAPAPSEAMGARDKFEASPSLPAAAGATTEDRVETGRPLGTTTSARKRETVALTNGAAPMVSEPTAGKVSAGGFGLHRYAHGPLMLNQAQQNTNALQNQGAAPNRLDQVGDASLASDRPPASSGMETLENQNLRSLEKQTALPSGSPGSVADGSVERAKPAPAMVPSAAGPFHIATPAVVPAPLWTIGSAGTLQRSFDQGNTWEDVSVKDQAVSPDRSLVLAPAPSASGSRLPASGSNLATPVFRAVVANGSDVWAGGTSGRLYHSVDAGNHWTKVVPATGGVHLAGDIVSVDFPDAQHGRVVTSAVETWTTADAGQTWQKQ